MFWGYALGRSDPVKKGEARTLSSLGPPNTLIWPWSRSKRLSPRDAVCVCSVLPAVCPSVCLSRRAWPSLGRPVLYLVRLAAALGAEIPAAVPVTMILAAISLLTATLKSHDDDDDDDDNDDSFIQFYWVLSWNGPGQQFHAWACPLNGKKPWVINHNKPSHSLQLAIRFYYSSFAVWNR